MQHIDFEIYNKPARVSLKKEIIEGLYPASFLKQPHDGLVLMTSDVSTSREIRNVIHKTRQEWMLTFWSDYDRKFIDKLTKLDIAVKRVSSNRIRLMGTGDMEAIISDAMLETDHQIKSLRCQSIHEVRLRELGPGNLRKFTKKERISLLRLL